MLAADMLAIGIQANVTTLLVALPGVAKTAVTRAITREIEERKYGGTGFPFVVTNAAQGLAEDVGGGQVPNHNDRIMDAYAMGSIKAFIAHKRGVHLCDEYGSASSGYRAAMLSVNEGRQYGDHHLPGVAVVCIMNPPEVATNGQDMTAPESNRFFWVRWELDNAAWFDYMRGGKGAVSEFPILPKDWEQTHLPKAKVLITSFLSRNPKLIYEMPAPENATGPWPSNRSWENAAKLFAATLACGYKMASDQVNAAVAGCVGKATGDVFFAWVKDMDLPDPEEMLAAPVLDAVRMVPDRHDRAIVCMESMASAAVEVSHKDYFNRWHKAWEIIGHIMKIKQDRVVDACKILANKMPKGGVFPPEAGQILAIRRQLGASKNGAGMV